MRGPAFSGINVKDTEDWYDQAIKLHPETLESLEDRYDEVANYYKNYPVPPGRSICVVVVTHKPITYNLPERLGEVDEEADSTGYCSSFSVKVR